MIMLNFEFRANNFNRDFVRRLCYHCNENNGSSFSYIANAAVGAADADGDGGGLCQRCARPLQPGLRAEDEDDDW